MTVIKKLNISSVRNIEAAQLELNSKVNVFFGANGSGKTSALEAINVLATGKSFRTSKLDSLISHSFPSSTVFAELTNAHKVGFSKSPRKPTIVRLDDSSLKSWEPVARLLPTLVLDSNSFQLIEGGPKIRRAYMDWGVFHVEQSFIENWRRVKRCIAHRNLLLKERKLDAQQVSVWSNELAVCADNVDRSRASYLELLSPYFQNALNKLAPGLAKGLSLEYQRGWSGGSNLLAVLDENLDSDRRYGVTQFGPHRAELLLKMSDNRANEVLSRGQLKITVMALKVAQGQLLAEHIGHSCNYLVDDLAAELDSENCAAVLNLLLEQKSQLLITAVDKDDILLNLPETTDHTTFHVERGIIRA